MKLCAALCAALLGGVGCNPSDTESPTAQPGKSQLAGGQQVQIPNGETTISVEGTQLFVRVIGRGEPLLVIHGGPGLDQSYLQPGMNGLAKWFTLIYFDQRASGRSTAALHPDQVSLPLFMSDIDGVREHFGLDRVDILGHSFGGLLAMRYAMDYPDRVGRLILSNSVPASSTLRQQEAESSNARMTDEELAEQAKIFASEAFKQRASAGFEEYFRFIFKREFADPAKLDQLVLDLPENFAANGALLNGLATDLQVYDWFDRLSGIEAPTLVIYGGHEASQVSQNLLVKSIPDAKLVILEDCGHFPYIEQPEAYFSSIREFLLP